MTELHVGDILEGRYRVDHPIARGGMATVYRCVDLRLGRAVAVKVMDERLQNNPQFRSRFRREARAMARLSSPNLVNIFDFGEDQTNLFFIMELIDGGTLRELLAERGPMPPHAAVAVMRSLLTGLRTMHRAGMVHRDIKPDNVLINGDHEVKLADFGLVQSLGRDEHSQGKIIGTVSYLSPEQVTGAPLTPASDVYSAGIVAFELLTGERPFSGATDLECAHARTRLPVPAPSSRIAGVPPEFDALLAKATAMNPDERFADAGEFLAALETLSETLHLPDFRVPVPRNAAASRAAAVPTNTKGLETPIEATKFPVDSPPTTHETRAMPPVDAAPSRPVSRPAPPPRRPDAMQRVPAQRPPQQVQRTETTPPPQATSRPTPRPVSNRSGLHLALSSGIIVALIIAVALGSWWLTSGRYGEIPQILGMDQRSGMTAVQEAGFVPAAEAVYDNSLSRGKAVGSQPGAGEQAVKGSQVVVLVSKGRPVVPDVPANRDPAELRAQLSERTLLWNDAEPVYSDEISEGKVVDTDPAAGEAVDVGTPVNVRLSRGPAPVQIPDVAKLPVDTARRLLEDAGLTVRAVVKEFSSEVRPNRAIGTNPTAGTQVPRGSDIVLQVSSAVEVPRVAGRDLEAARLALAQSGATAGEVTRDASKSSRDPNEVVGTSPKGGSIIDPADARVDIILPGKITVPSVLGKTPAEARRVLESKGFEVETDGSVDSQDRVIYQSPLTGERPYGSTVSLKFL